MSDPLDPLIRKAIKGLDLSVPNLEKAAQFSREILNLLRDELIGMVPPGSAPGLDVVVFGSFARFEGGAESDIDAVVAVHRLPEEVKSTRLLLASLDRIQSEHKLKQPGKSGIFGGIVSVPDIVERIGLEQDTNLNHSRRALLLQESCSIYDPKAHSQLLGLLIDRYLVDYATPKKGVPRFLLNDFIRYWRTIAVDYQAKRWEGGAKEWGLRYLKLRISRKLAFAGGLVSILLAPEATKEYFVRQFSMPSLARLAQLFERLDKAHWDSLRTVFRVADYFVGKLENEEFRIEAKKVETTSDVKEDSAFHDAMSKAEELQTALEDIFFRSKLLSDLSIKYLSF